ncbi:MAG TPA: hypothetical protein VLI69_05520 [Gammaproteobacteria bacterium]|nr:hypothetical protein [Gammaproteobacteria bacterium]
MLKNYDETDDLSDKKDDLEEKYFRYVDSISVGQYNEIAKNIVSEVIKNSYTASNYSTESISQHIKDALNFLIDLRNNAINRYARYTDEKSKYSSIYQDNDWPKVSDNFYVKHSNSTSISIGEIQCIIPRYLNAEWSSETLEWLMMNAYIKQDLYENAQILIQDYTALSVKASLYFAGKCKLCFYILKFLLYHMRLDWILYSLIIFVLLRNGLTSLTGHQPLSGIITLSLTIFIVLNLLLNIYPNSRRRKQFNEELEKKIDLKNFITQRAWSPTTLKNKMEAMNLEETFYPSFIPLLNKMIARNPHQFTVKMVC